MKRLLTILKRKHEIKWRPFPDPSGWYLSWEPGRGFDELFWPGDADTFERPLRKEAHYLGPFTLPL
jgi:hypothetical protein